MSEENTDATKENTSLGCFTATKAFFELYETARPHLSKEQLHLMVNAENHVTLKADNLSLITSTLATLIANDKSGSWSPERDVPMLLWHLSYEFDEISALIELSTSARFELKQRNSKVVQS